MDGEFRTILVYIKMDNLLKLLIFENNIYKKYSLSLLNLATKYSFILNTLT